MKLHLIKFAAFCLLFVGVKATGQDNLTVIDSLVLNLAEEISESSKGKLQDAQVVLDVNGVDKEFAGYLRLKLGNYFSSKNQMVFRNFPADSSFEGTIIEIQNIQIGITYSEPYDKKLLGNNFVRRHFLLLLDGQVYHSKNNNIIVPVKSKIQHTDEIKFDDIEQIENSPYKFTHGKMAEITFWQKVLEPALVVSSVLVVLLLLFTQRS